VYNTYDILAQMMRLFGLVGMRSFGLVNGLMTQNRKVIAFKSDHSHFEITTPDNARNMVAIGNELGLNRVCLGTPENMIATMRQRTGKTLIELVWPNGDSLLRESGRIDAKRVAGDLLSMGIRVLNVKKGGGVVELTP
tara:strand:- start:850 stop:1263 length:414 start_codon:yes stop_codon:yes gene_type:complete